MLKPRLLRRIVWFLPPLLCAAFLVGCVEEKTWKVGAAAPEISVLDLGDRTVKLSEFMGKPVVLRFWATGCNACVAGMPVLDKISKSYRDRGLVVLAVNMGSSKPMVEAFAKGLKLTYPVFLDQALIATKKYEVRSAPTTFFIDSKGVARKAVLGEVSPGVFRNTVEELF